jgi:hypothetical protein
MNKLISLAVRAAVGWALAGAASALTLPAYTSGNTVPIAGAPSTDGILLDALLDATSGFCIDDPTFGANVAEFFTVDTAATLDFSHPRNFAVACVVKPGNFPLTAGAVDMVLKLSGESSSGTADIVAGLPVLSSGDGVWVDAIACQANTPVNNAAPTTGGIHVKVYTSCPVFAPGLPPKMGISDVEAGLVGTSSTSGLSPPTKTIGAVFAPIVSKNFEVALQSLQGLAGCDGTAASQTAACLPSLSSAQLRGFYTGGINLTIDIVSGTNLSISSPASGNQTIFVCRRANTSGTQVVFQTAFLRQGCRGSPLTFVAGDTPGGSAWIGSAAQLALTAFTGIGASDVLACVAAHSVNGDYAIGIASTENALDDTNANAFRYIKVDGQVPSLEETVAGNYSLFTENLFYFSTISTNPLVGEQIGMSIILPPLLFADGNRPISHALPFAFGHGGVLAIPDGASNIPQLPPYTPLTTYVNTQVKSVAVGGVLNSCAPPGQYPSGLLVPVGLVNR